MASYTARDVKLASEPYEQILRRRAAGISDAHKYPAPRVEALGGIADPEALARRALEKRREAERDAKAGEAPPEPDLSTGALRAAHRLQQARSARAATEATPKKKPKTRQAKRAARPARAVPTPPKDGAPGNRKARRAAKRISKQADQRPAPITQKPME